MTTHKPTAPTGLKDRIANRAATTDVAERPRTLTEQIYALVPEMTKVLESEAKATRMARIAITEFRKNPKLGQCDPITFFGSLLTASQLRLEPGPLGHAYLVPYSGNVTLQIGYRGMLELVSRADKVDTIYAYPVYQGDVFRYQLGSKPDIQHEPCGESDDDKLTHVYAVAHLKGSSLPRIEVMSRVQVDAIRKRSSSDQAAKKYGKSTPWDTDYAEMAKKTVMKRLCKTLPLSVEVQAGIAADETVRTKLDLEDGLVSMFDAAPKVERDIEMEPPPEEVEHKKPTGKSTAHKPVDKAPQKPVENTLAEEPPHPAEVAGGDGLFDE